MAHLKAFLQSKNIFEEPSTILAFLGTLADVFFGPSIRPPKSLFSRRPTLEKEFDWISGNVKDAHELAKDILDAHPAIAEFSKYLTDGAHC